MLPVRKERKLKVLENRLRRQISGPKREEVAGGWRKLHNKEYYDLYSSRNNIKKKR